MVGIVIVTYNSEKYIETGLKAVFSELELLKGEMKKYPLRPVVVVVDNKSQDNTLDIVRNNFSKTEILENKRNIGFARAVNKGIRHCEKFGSKFILLLNPDTKMEKGALSEMIKVMEKENDEYGDRKPDNLLTRKPVAIVQPLITLMKDPERINTSGNRYRGFGLVTLGDFGNKVLSFDSHPNSLNRPNNPINFASGACMLIRSSVFEKAGLFDERFFLYYEDTEFSERVRRSGFEIYLAAKARVQHDYSRALSWRKLKFFLSGWWKYYVKA